MQPIENIEKLVNQFKQGSITPLDMAQQALGQANDQEALNAFVSLDDTIVLEQAKASSKRYADGTSLSAIDGIPIAVKDNYLTKDYPTTACSDAMPLEPQNIDATIIANLRAAGAVIFGKTNMHEWAYGATNNTSNIGVTYNPHNPECITGGSSGGSAAVVAAGIVPAALGSDTGGSVRIPSSACGIYGFKPSYGRASRHGVLPLSWSLDAPGPMAAHLDDIKALLPFFLGTDPQDPTTAHAQNMARLPSIDDFKLINLVGEGLERATDVDQALNHALAALEADVTTHQITGCNQYFAAWETILHCEASAYHTQLLRHNPEGFSPVTRAHLEAGNRISAVELLKAQQLRAQLISLLLHQMPDWDALVLPTLPVTAPKHGQDWQEFGGKKVTTQDSMTWFCWIGNLSGLPCVTLPIGKSENGMPIGMMLMGRPGKDETVLAIAQKIDGQLNELS